MRVAVLAVALAACARPAAPEVTAAPAAPEQLTLTFRWPDGAWGSETRAHTWVGADGVSRGLVVDADVGVSREPDRWLFQPNVRDLTPAPGSPLDGALAREAALVGMPWVRALDAGGRLLGFADRRAAVAPLYEPGPSVAHAVDGLLVTVEDDGVDRDALIAAALDGFPPPHGFDRLQQRAIRAWDLGLPWWHGREVVLGGDAIVEEGPIAWPDVEGVVGRTTGRAVGRVPCGGARGPARCVRLELAREGAAADVYEVRGVWVLEVDAETLLPWRLEVRTEVREGDAPPRSEEERATWAWVVR